MADKVREAFEAWWNGETPGDPMPYGNGVQGHAWMAWQASCAALDAPAPTDKVREAAGALCYYLDETSGGAEWKGAPLVRRLRAALAAPLAAPSDDATEGARLAYALQRPDSPQARILTILGIYRDKMPVAAVEALQIMADQLALAAPSGGGDAPTRDAVAEVLAPLVAKARRPVPKMDGSHNQNPADLAIAREMADAVVALVPKGGDATRDEAVEFAEWERQYRSVMFHCEINPAFMLREGRVFSIKDGAPRFYDYAADKGWLVYKLTRAALVPQQGGAR